MKSWAMIGWNVRTIAYFSGAKRDAAAPISRQIWTCHVCDTTRDVSFAFVEQVRRQHSLHLVSAHAQTHTEEFMEDTIHAMCLKCQELLIKRTLTQTEVKWLLNSYFLSFVTYPGGQNNRNTSNPQLLSIDELTADKQQKTQRNGSSCWCCRVSYNNQSFVRLSRLSLVNR